MSGSIVLEGRKLAMRRLIYLSVLGCLILLWGCGTPEDPQKHIKNLYSWDERVRLQAGNELVLMGERAVPVVIKELERSQRPQVKYICVQILGRIGNKQATPHLIPFLKSENRYIAAKTAEALGIIVDLRAAEALIEAAKDTCADLRANAVLALGKMKSPQAWEIIFKSLSDSTVKVRSKALQAVGRYRYPQVAPQVIQMVSDPSPTVRLKAVQALRWIGDKPGVVDALIKALDDSHLSVRLQAIISLQVIGNPKAIAPLEKLAARGGERDRRAANWAIEEIKKQAGRK